MPARPPTPPAGPRLGRLAKPLLMPLLMPLLGLLAALPGGAAAARPIACEKVVISADPAYPPLHWHDGNGLVGASIDIATTVLRDLGVPYEVRYVGPWARVLHAAELGQIDMVATLKDTPERRAYLAFPSEPAFDNPVAVFAPVDTPIRYRRWQDLVGWRGGLTLGNKFGGGFDEFLERHLTVQSVSRPELNFQKMRAGRIDYFVTGLYAGQALLAQEGMEGDIQPLTPHVTQTSNYVAFVKSSPCAGLLPAFERRLRALRRERLAERLLADNLARWRAAHGGR